MSLRDAVLDVGHGADVQRGMRQCAVHERQSEIRQDAVDQRHDHHVPVVRRTLLQPIRQVYAASRVALIENAFLYVTDI